MRQFTLFVVAVVTIAATPARADGPIRFEVTLDRAAAKEPVSGRLYVFLSKREKEPMRGPNWFAPEPFFRLDVNRFQPGETRVVDDSAEGFPDVLSRTPAGKYTAQAILDSNFYSPRPVGAGNQHSPAQKIELKGDEGPAEQANGSAAQQTFRLTLDRVVPPRRFPETAQLKEVVLRSKLLSGFHRREVLEYAAVVLPASYATAPERRYPVVYIIPGFGGDHFDALRLEKRMPEAHEDEAEFIRVYLSGACKWGHHTYADSATNGPRGEALVQEMIPEIDRQFRTMAAPTARFVMGHSSGGWASLWLLVNYSDVFGGVWSSAPDAVDFRDYQHVNLYADAPQNMYIDEKGQRRPIARRGETPVLWYDTFTRMDDVLGRGGQLRSFEAVFSPLDKDGLPRRLYDRKTGQVDPEVAKSWQKYDISLKLEREWEKLGPKLAGKIHVTMGTLDTFYLEGATLLLAERLKKLGSDAKITIVEGADHRTVIDKAYLRCVRREMSEAFWREHPEWRSAASKSPN